MNLTIKKMDIEGAKRTLSWVYEPPYDFYNNEVNEEEINERLDGSYRLLVDENNKVVGFLCSGETAQIPVGHTYGVYPDNFIDIGFGMDPNYTGQGNGYEFCTIIMNYIKEQYVRMPIRLSVATFNNRAIHLYEKLGFKKKDAFTTDYAEFITMIKED
ncbi:GNAT family N-acetyltransferase [Alkalihalobacillus sp. CinArs1]|uniref:GNAT family N-acetyltransferase n=1 Tax=Alkalihalobacillus sp. CinArs1 TaxID=2995314 RepID=UPI0022DDEE1D|nr:GNAT family N-acetyltransferase [Alkalihalobacillus sp. CinArs1]